MIFVLMAATCLRSEAVLQVGFLACAGVTEKKFCQGFRPSEKKVSDGLFMPMLAVCGEMVCRAWSDFGLIQNVIFTSRQRFIWIFEIKLQNKWQNTHQ